MAIRHWERLGGIAPGVLGSRPGLGDRAGWWQCVCVCARENADARVQACVRARVGGWVVERECRKLLVFQLRFGHRNFEIEFQCLRWSPWPQPQYFPAVLPIPDMDS